MTEPNPGGNRAERRAQARAGNRRPRGPVVGKHRPWIGQAREALRLAVADDFLGSAAVVRQMQAEHGNDKVIDAMAVWIDDAAAHAGWRDTEVMLSLAFRAVETGEIIRNADEVRPTAAWAGRMFTARLARDEDTWWALIAAVPNDPAAVGAHVTELLQSAALAFHPDGTKLSWHVTEG